MEFSEMNMYKPMMFEFEDIFQPTSTLPEAELVKTINNCSAVCFNTMAQIAGKESRGKQLKLLHDCARICASQTIYIVTNSMFSKLHAQMCAIICEACAKECAKHPDQLSQYCARVCYDCAVACRRYAGLM